MIDIERENKYGAKIKQMPKSAQQECNAIVHEHWLDCLEFLASGNKQCRYWINHIEDCKKFHLKIVFLAKNAKFYVSLPKNVK